jgi:hypothetical protein
MGFEAPLSYMRLRFTDPSYEGLEVLVRMVDGDTLAEAAELRTVDLTNVQPHDLKALLDGFASCLVEWNLTVKGRPIPATRAGLKKLDVLFQMQMITSWLTAFGQALDDIRQAAAEAEEVAPTLPVTPL